MKPHHLLIACTALLANILASPLTHAGEACAPSKTIRPLFKDMNCMWELQGDKSTVGAQGVDKRACICTVAEDEDDQHPNITPAAWDKNQQRVDNKMLRVNRETRPAVGGQSQETLPAAGGQNQKRSLWFSPLIEPYSPPHDPGMTRIKTLKLEGSLELPGQADEPLVKDKDGTKVKAPKDPVGKKSIFTK